MVMHLITEFQNTYTKSIELQGEIDKHIFIKIYSNTPLSIIDKQRRSLRRHIWTRHQPFSSSWYLKNTTHPKSDYLYSDTFFS